MFVFSAPGQSPPPVSGNTHGTIRSDVSEINRGILKICGILNSQQGAGGQSQSVGVIRTLSLVEYTLTVV